MNLLGLLILLKTHVQILEYSANQSDKDGSLGMAQWAWLHKQVS